MTNTLTAPEVLLDPTGLDAVAADHTLAPRPTTLRGITVGLLDNTKPNSMTLLKDIVSALEPRYGEITTKEYVKHYFGTPALPDLLERIAQECDVVLTAVGDCGSCSAATVADGILLERLGVPTVSICSSSFVMSGRAMAAVQGFPGFEFITVEHPISSLDAAQLHDRSAAVIPDVLRVLGIED